MKNAILFDLKINKIMILMKINLRKSRHVCRESMFQAHVSSKLDGLTAQKKQTSKN